MLFFSELYGHCFECVCGGEVVVLFLYFRIATYYYSAIPTFPCSAVLRKSKLDASWHGATVDFLLGRHYVGTMPLGEHGPFRRSANFREPPENPTNKLPI